MLSKRYFLIYCAACAILVIAPAFLSEYLIHILIMILLYAYLGQCWNILGGYAGIVSFGHAAFYGLGAYAAVYLFTRWGISPLIGMVIGGGLAAGLAFIIGFGCFRFKLQGIFFSLVTLSVAEILLIMAQNYFKGGGMGIEIPVREPSPWDLHFASKTYYYYLILAFVAALYFLVWRIQISKVGLYLMAIRENEIAAEDAGVNAFKYKMIALCLSAFLTAIGGAFYSQLLLFVDPEVAFRVNVSIEIIIRPFLGGLGTLFGPLIGSIILTPTGEIMNVILGTYKGVHLVIYGAILIVIMIFWPKGIAGYFGKSKKGKLY
jgi:branched-chain amino acid transport system permease protein